MRARQKRVAPRPDPAAYAVTMHRRGTWIELRDNLFLDNDSGVFLNTFFLNNDQAQGRIDPHLTLAGNVFTGTRSFSTAFPDRTGRSFRARAARTSPKTSSSTATASWNGNPRPAAAPS